MSAQKRRKVFVDSHVQGALVKRALIHWMWGSIIFLLIIFCYRIGPSYIADTYEDPGFWYHFGPILVATLVLLPAVMLNTFRFSNRFVGPMLRLRESLKDLAQGKIVDPISFREGDFWSGVADDFNMVVARLSKERCPQSAHANEPRTTTVSEDPVSQVTAS